MFMPWLCSYLRDACLFLSFMPPYVFVDVKHFSLAAVKGCKGRSRCFRLLFFIVFMSWWTDLPCAKKMKIGKAFTKILSLLWLLLRTPTCAFDTCKKLLRIVFIFLLTYVLSKQILNPPLLQNKPTIILAYIFGGKVLYATLAKCKYSERRFIKSCINSNHAETFLVQSLAIYVYK